MDWKETLQMPNTDFEMRGNLPKKEPLILKKWEDEKLYEVMMKAHEHDESFILHDGPPYANNNLHMGTAMNRVIKDFILKSHYLAGYNTPFYPGWDTHGLPIENMMPKLGYDRKKMTTAEFRTQCQKYAQAQVAIQMATEKRLGCVADYEHPYLTYSKEYEADEVRSFAKMAMQGLVYQGLKPIYWSPERESAVADTETYYEDKTDDTIYVSFDVVDAKGVLDGDEKFVIWTTTPWTIPADLAIALNPGFTYAVVQTTKGKLIVLDKLVETLMTKFGLSDYKILKTYLGKDLEYITVKHPFYDRTSLVVLANYVTDQDGTGCVHTAPGHGMDDYLTGLRYHLPAFCPVDEKGCLTKEAGDDLNGVFVFKANNLVIEKLKNDGHLLAVEKYTHSYPFDERMKKPVIYRATVQWFASIEKIREQLLAQVKKVNWINDFGEVRLYNMIKDRGDWCISRQRVWGVPIPIFYNEDKSPIFDEKVFEHVAQLFAEHGSNIWFEKEAKELLPEGYTNPKSPNGLFTKEKDIMDVWFDSGSSFNSLIARNYPYPCDLYFEGSDQYRGWFNSSLIVATATTGQAPYKSVLSHGYVLDGKGIKMSKSLGNVVDPMKIIDVYGADIIRLWAATSDYTQDVRCSDDLMKHVSEQYRKIRNTFKFMLSVTNSVGKNGKTDFAYLTDKVEYAKMNPLNQYLEIKLNEVVKKAKTAYQNYDYVTVVNTISNFLTNELSSFYLDFTKDILYIEKVDDNNRRQSQTVIYDCLNALLSLLAPIISYTAEEIWSKANTYDGKSVFLHNFPEVKDYSGSKELTEFYEKFFLVRDDVLKALENARVKEIIHKSLEAEVVLNLNPEYQALSERYSPSQLAQLLIVSKVTYSKDKMEEYSIGSIEIKKAEGKVCQRCWNIVPEVNADGLCPRCEKVLK